MINRHELEKLANTLGGIPVWGALPGSISREAGVRYGDVVLKVNGVATPTIDEYLEARELKNDSVDLVLFRDGQEIELSLKFRPENPDMAQAVEQVVEGRMLPSERPSKPPSSD